MPYLIAQYQCISAPYKSTCLLAGAVLAPPLGDLGAVGRGQRSPKGAGNPENFVGHIVKYAVFGIKPTYNQYKLQGAVGSQTSDCGGMSNQINQIWL